MKRVHENIFSNLTLNFPLFLPSLKEGLQSHRVTSDFRQHVSLALERQLSGQLANSYASSLVNLPINTQGSTILTAKSTAKQHPPLTASNSVATCNAATHLKALMPREHRKLDRSASEPAEKCARQVPPPPPNSSRYKTELCRPFEESGTCKYGDKCQFAHGYGELRTLSRHPKYKTELCRTFHSTGFCPYGPRCHFIHNSEDSKKCLLNTLQSGNNGHLSPSSMDYDISGFSIGSAGDLSPTSSVSSSGSPTSSLSGFFLDDTHVPYPMPLTAPPTMTSGGFFGGDYVPLKPLSALTTLIPNDDYLSQQANSSDDEVLSSIDVMMSELELEESLCESNGNAESITTKTESAAVDINRNLIRLPIFSRLSLGSSP